MLVAASAIGALRPRKRTSPTPAPPVPEHTASGRLGKAGTHHQSLQHAGRAGTSVIYPGRRYLLMVDSGQAAVRAGPPDTRFPSLRDSRVTRRRSGIIEVSC